MIASAFKGKLQRKTALNTTRRSRIVLIHSASLVEVRSITSVCSRFVLELLLEYIERCMVGPKVIVDEHTVKLGFL